MPQENYQDLVEALAGTDEGRRRNVAGLTNNWLLTSDPDSTPEGATDSLFWGEMMAEDTDPDRNPFVSIWAYLRDALGEDNQDGEKA